jgi:hypothetical protein
LGVNIRDFCLIEFWSLGFVTTISDTEGALWALAGAAIVPARISVANPLIPTRRVTFGIRASFKALRIFWPARAEIQQNR